MKAYDFKLDDYSEEYYRIYEATRNVDFNSVPSFKLIKEYLDIKDGDVILDGGCGAGHLMEFFTSGKHVTRISCDISEAALYLAKRDFNSGKYFKQDLRYLGFRDNTFDKILSFNVIEHIENQDQVLQEFKRVLKPNGNLVMGTNIRDSIQWWLYQKFIGEHTHVREFKTKEFVDFIGNFFKILEYKRSSGVFRFPPPLSWLFHYILLGDIIVKAQNNK